MATITIEVKDIPFVQTHYGVTLLNRGCHKIANSPKGFVWEVKVETIRKDESKREHRMLYKKLEDAICHLLSTEASNMETFSGNKAIPKIIGDNHIQLWGLNADGEDVTYQLTTVHLF